MGLNDIDSFKPWKHLLVPKFGWCDNLPFIFENKHLYNLNQTNNLFLVETVLGLAKDRSAWPPFSHLFISTAKGQERLSSTKSRASLQPSVAEVALARANPCGIPMHVTT